MLPVQSHPAYQALPAPPATILIVDDEPVQLRAMVAEMNALGFETLIAQDGADGLAKAKRGRPDLILLDIQMPGWDGYQTCERLRASPATRTIPVIFLSVMDRAEHKLRGFDAGCIDYITKPWNQRELLARVKAQLRLQRLLARRENDRCSAVAGNATAPAAAAPSRSIDGDSAEESASLHRVQQASAILLAEMQSPPSLAQLVRRVGTNHSTLGKAFQRHLGMTAFEYLREQRLARAQQLLATTDRQIQLIADDIGFRRTGDFATAFKRRFGITPRQYRRQHQPD